MLDRSRLEASETRLDENICFMGSFIFFYHIYYAISHSITTINTLLHSKPTHIRRPITDSWLSTHTPRVSVINRRLSPHSA